MLVGRARHVLHLWMGRLGEMKNTFHRRSGIGLVVGFVLIVIVLGGSIVLASGTKVVPPDPSAGLTDAQRAKIYSAGRNESDARYESWLASLNLTQINYGALQRHPILGLYEPGAPTLAAAKARADLIVLGKVRSIRPTAFDGTYVTLEVEGLVKGTAGATLVLHQSGGLRPTQDWKGMFIAEGLDAPLMIPNDRAVVFLHIGSKGSLEIQGFTGLYQSKFGRISAVPGNPFANDVDGMIEAEFIGMKVHGISADLASIERARSAASG
jgi:hypothetical protein